MKRSLSTLTPVFNTHRMVHEYFNDCYQPAIERFTKLDTDHAKLTREFTLWRRHVTDNWHAVAIQKVHAEDGSLCQVGGSKQIIATVRLGALKPEDVRVELYAGLVDSSDELVDAAPIAMSCTGGSGPDFTFQGEIPFVKSGKLGYSLRVIPSHPVEATYQDHMLITWADDTIAG